jgi:hypothetical protein
MKAIRFIASAIYAHTYRLVLLAILVFAAYVFMSGQGETRPAFVWTATSAWGALTAVLALTRLAYLAGIESRYRHIAYWREHAEKWERLHRTMIDVNRTMIDDVLLAQKHGLPVQTFLHTGRRRESNPQDDDRTAGA